MIGVISALPEEASGLIELISNSNTEVRGNRHFTKGYLYDKEIVFVNSKAGKIASDSGP